MNSKSVLNIIKDVELKDSSKVNLVEIRNPSGSSQWKGRFSDTDAQSWSNVVDPNIRCMKLDRKGRIKNANDGRSFITFITNVALYDTLTAILKNKLSFFFLSIR